MGRLSSGSPRSFWRGWIERTTEDAQTTPGGARSREDDPITLVTQPAFGAGALGEESGMERLSWTDICHREEFRGRWVALDGCRYDEDSGRAVEGAVVDVDQDLVELCTRMRESEHKNCAILFCGEECPGQDSAVEDDPFQHAAH
jgi:hypothetical protein